MATPELGIMNRLLIEKPDLQQQGPVLARVGVQPTALVEKNAPSRPAHALQLSPLRRRESDGAIASNGRPVNLADPCADTAKANALQKLVELDL